VLCLVKETFELRMRRSVVYVNYDVMHSVRTFGVSDLVPRVVVVLSLFKARISFHILSLKFCYFHCEM
jgi:hypothetical protein